MSFDGPAFGSGDIQDPEETTSFLGRAKDLAKGLAFPVTAFFHILFKVQHASLHRHLQTFVTACAHLQLSLTFLRLATCTQSLALVVYMFGTWFSSSFVNVFIVCILLLAADFWTVKNVSGRLMVGLRWWSEVLDDGSTVWKYEAKEVRVRIACRCCSVRV